MRWRPETSAQWPRQCMWQCKCNPQRHHEISLPPKKGGPFGLTVIASAAVHVAACRFQYRLSNLRTNNARAKVVSSGCVASKVVNGAMPPRKHSNRENFGIPAGKRPREEGLEGAFQL
mmetsp:Transcript_6818/g.16003  ORF Transcript_6818/g.16003 Transcript_6818/m.16003 type:complete len:118 (+) Transcript_6818:1028-1381(+)